MFLAAIASGVDFRRSLLLYGGLTNKTYLFDECSYYPVGEKLGPLSARAEVLQLAERLLLPGTEGASGWLVFAFADEVAAIVSSQPIPCDGWRSCAVLLAAALLYYEQGRLIIPTSRVTALVEAGQA